MCDVIASLNDTDGDLNNLASCVGAGFPVELPGTCICSLPGAISLVLASKSEVFGARSALFLDVIFPDVWSIVGLSY